MVEKRKTAVISAHLPAITPSFFFGGLKLCSKQKPQATSTSRYPPLDVDALPSCSSITFLNPLSTASPAPPLRTHTFLPPFKPSFHRMNSSLPPIPLEHPLPHQHYFPNDISPFSLRYPPPPILPSNPQRPSLSLSSEGRFLAAVSFDGTCSVWRRQRNEAATSAELELELSATLEGHENEVLVLHTSVRLTASCLQLNVVLVCCWTVL